MMISAMTKTHSHKVDEATLARDKKNAQLREIIRPVETPRYETDISWSYLERSLKKWGEDYQGLDLTPDFQRGHVWTPYQQQHFVENVLRGIVSSSSLSLQFNCPNWEPSESETDLPPGFQCLDGLQRLTAVIKFLNGEVRPFGLGVRDLDGSSFSMQRITLTRFRVAVFNFRKRSDLIQHYLDFNAGGTPHSSDEIARVHDLLNKSKSE